MKSVSLFIVGVWMTFSNPLLAETPKNFKTILMFGDSITAGYGVSEEESYPALIQKRIDAEKLPYRVIPAGLSGDTTSAGVDRLKWVMRQPIDILLFALGGNDGLRGVSPEVTSKNLQTMIDFARQKNPDIKIILAGMKMPPNYGTEFTEKYAAVFPALAKKNKVILIPFFLEKVGGVAQMNQPDRIHPTAQGHKLIAETVWKTLQPIFHADKKL